MNTPCGNTVAELANDRPYTKYDNWDYNQAIREDRESFINGLFQGKKMRGNKSNVEWVINDTFDYLSDEDQELILSQCKEDPRIFYADFIAGKKPFWQLKILSAARKIADKHVGQYLI